MAFWNHCCIHFFSSCFSSEKPKESNIAAARAAFFPTITLSPYIGLNSFRLANIFDPAFIIFGLAGGLTAPLFNRVAIQSHYNRSEAEAKEAFFSIRKQLSAPIPR